MHIALLAALPLALSVGAMNVSLPTDPANTRAALLPRLPPGWIDGVYCQSADTGLNQFVLDKNIEDLGIAIAQYNSEHANACSQGRLNGTSEPQFVEKFTRSDGVKLVVLSFWYKETQLFTALLSVDDAPPDLKGLGI